RENAAPQFSWKSGILWHCACSSTPLAERSRCPRGATPGEAARRESQMFVVRARGATGGSGRARAFRRSSRDPRHLPAPRTGISSYLAVTLVPGSAAAVGGESEGVGVVRVPSTAV